MPSFLGSRDGALYAARAQRLHDFTQWIVHKTWSMQTIDLGKKGATTKATGTAPAPSKSLKKMRLLAKAQASTTSRLELMCFTTLPH
eukprot:jgi/Botrbrau1/18726/Bobra.0386s0049.1